MISLITTDVCDTLGIFTKPTVNDILFDLSGIPAVEGKGQLVGEAVRHFLHTTPELTNEAIWDLCGALLIDQRAWPDPWPRGGFEPYPYTNEALAELNRIAPVAALSNLSILSATRMDDLHQYCGQYLDDIFTSYDMGHRKPDLRLWLDIADIYGIPADEIVHIGDRWVPDICGAHSAGAYAIYVTGTREDHHPIPSHEHMRDRFAVVTDLCGAPAVIQAWRDQDPTSSGSDSRK